MSDSAPLPSPSAPPAAASLPASAPPPRSILLSRSPSSFSSPTPQPQTHKGGILLQPTVSRSNAPVTTTGPATRVVSSGSRITFAPLPPPPPEDEKRRRNSISVGVAARGQILRSQGATGKKANNNGVIYVPMTDEEWEAYKEKFNRSQGIPSEVPDLGTLAMKGGRKLLSSIRRSMSSSSTTSSTTSNASNKATAAGVSAPPTIAPIPPPFQRTSSTLSTTSTGPVPSSPESSEAFSLSPTSQLEPPLLPSPPPELDNDEEFDESPILLDGEGRRPSFSIRARAYSPPPLESYEPTPEEYGMGMSSAGSTSGSSILEEDEDEEEEEEEEEEEKKLNTAGAGNTTPKRRGSFSGLEHLHLGGHGGHGGGEDREGSSTPMGKTSFVLGFETLTTSGPLKEDVESWRKERRASQGSRGSGDEERRRSGSGEEKR